MIQWILGTLIFILLTVQAKGAATPILVHENPLWMGCPLAKILDASPCSGPNARQTQACEKLKISLKNEGCHAFSVLKNNNESLKELNQILYGTVGAENVHTSMGVAWGLVGGPLIEILEVALVSPVVGVLAMTGKLKWVKSLKVFNDFLNVGEKLLPTKLWVSFIATTLGAFKLNKEIKETPAQEHLSFDEMRLHVLVQDIDRDSGSYSFSDIEKEREALSVTYPKVKIQIQNDYNQKLKALKIRDDWFKGVFKLKTYKLAWRRLSEMDDVELLEKMIEKESDSSLYAMKTYVGYSRLALRLRELTLKESSVKHVSQASVGLHRL